MLLGYINLVWLKEIRKEMKGRERQTEENSTPVPRKMLHFVFLSMYVMHQDVENKFIQGY